MTVIRKLLIANRGEIAVRVARAARDLGIRTVAVYSAADEDCGHRFAADESLCIGPAAASSSYLHRETLVQAALGRGCDAVHPGYGFLSEDPTFAALVADEGLTWVGAAAATIRRMGDKAAARVAAVQAGVPVVPGSDGALATDEEFVEFGHRHGYPLLLKARAGGGGKGMRVVEAEDDLRGALRLARQEAEASFGDGALYVERYLGRVRHVEVQILGDQTGRVVAVGQRDCSLQRRHQKLVEEAPAWYPPDARSGEMAARATELGAAVGYLGAGTVEFLVDAATGEFFFIEMNTRIQVEHPVTEEVAGIDLVAWQLRVAGGEELDLGALIPRGHAVEFRVTAEDPYRDFAPRPGQLTRFEMPSGPGVRVDTHCRAGYRVPPHYDSLLAKIVVTGRDRPHALQRARRALAETRIEGVPTTVPFHRWLLDHHEFVGGTHTTTFLATVDPSTALAEEPR